MACSGIYIMRTVRQGGVSGKILRIRIRLRRIGSILSRQSDSLNALPFFYHDTIIAFNMNKQANYKEREFA